MEMLRCRNCLIALAVIALALAALPAQADRPTVTRGQAIHHDTSPPIREIAIRVAPPTGLTKEVPIRQKPDFGGQRGPAEPDGGLQSGFGPSLGPTPAPLQSFQGLSDDDNAAVVGFRIVPPDTNGDIGLDGSGNKVYLQYINLIWALYSETGALLAGPFAGNSFWQGFGGFCETNNDGDPVVLYDDHAGRWMVSQFSINQGIQCVAVSTTGDPMGSYHRYAFTVTPGGQNDYPKMGVWDDGTTGSTGQSAYTFTMRDFGGAGGSFSVSAGVMERDAMLTGAPAEFVKFSNPCTPIDCVEGQLPPHLAGPPPPAGTCPTYWTAVDSAYDDDPAGIDGYRNHTLCVDWSNTAATYTEGPIVPAGSNFDRFLGNGFSDCISPVNGGEVLDCLAAFTMFRAQYRWFGTEAAVVFNTTVDAGGDRAGIRWAETLSATGDSNWTLGQDGTYAPADGSDRWMGSIAQDQDRNIALGYSITSGSRFPSVAYTSRMAGDPAGTMPGGEVTCHEGTGAQVSSSNRWGDYSSMSVDPQDDCTFWYTQEYYENTNSFDFKTRICSFKFADCGTPCSPTEPTEVTCDDGVDNDCDGFVDCDDTDCAVDPACVEDPCGDGVCDPGIGENCDTCAADCPSGADGPFCGNGVCEPTEDCVSCAADCNGKQNGKPANRYCCGGDAGGGGGENPVDCNDSRCTSGGNTCSSLPVLGFCCGDLLCDGGDECTLCDVDCSSDPVCDAPAECVPGTGTGERNDPCDVDEDCASCNCRGNGRCGN
jgi:hypothetical protein